MVTQTRLTAVCLFAVSEEYCQPHPVSRFARKRNGDGVFRHLVCGLLALEHRQCICPDRRAENIGKILKIAARAIASGAVVSGGVSKDGRHPLRFVPSMCMEGHLGLLGRELTKVAHVVSRLV